MGRMSGSRFKLQFLFLVCSPSGAEALQQCNEGLDTLLVAGTRPPDCVSLEMWDLGVSAANRRPLSSPLVWLWLPLPMQNYDFKILLVKV